MKNVFSSALRCQAEYCAHPLRPGVTSNAPLFICSMMLVGLLFAGCKKENTNSPADELQSINKPAPNLDGDAVTNYTTLAPQTIWEMQQARAATAKYRDIKNAIKDGYTNIGVDVENMGHHLMNANLVDGTFDVRKPEILVYNGLDTGNPELVAVEYAIPLTYPKPEGFTGSNDVWNGTSGFPLWLCHAWVWTYNPDGAFNWTNPLITLD